jgi:hypothetical protein
MHVHILSAPQRRMLLEMLASERAGEDALYVGRTLGRDRTASGLCRLRMTDWVDEQNIIFTDYGRHVAETLATRLVDRSAYYELVC